MQKGVLMMITTEYMKAVDRLETDIDMALMDYYTTGDTKHLYKAHKLNLELEAERRTHYYDN
jgi:hypothetical protein